MEYPVHHRQIVESLIGGRFITSKEELFTSLQKDDEHYYTFFDKSFGFELIITSRYAYLVSEESNEMLSRDITLFFAIICFELDKEGKNFLNELEFGNFSYEEIDKYFDSSSFTEVIQSNSQLRDSEKRRNLINTLTRRNIIDKINEDRFMFTAAHTVFCEFAQSLVTSIAQQH